MKSTHAGHEILGKMDGLVSSNNFSRDFNLLGSHRCRPALLSP